MLKQHIRDGSCSLLLTVAENGLLEVEFGTRDHNFIVICALHSDARMLVKWPKKINRASKGKKARVLRMETYLARTKFNASPKI